MFGNMMEECSSKALDSDMKIEFLTLFSIKVAHFSL